MFFSPYPPEGYVLARGFKAFRILWCGKHGLGGLTPVGGSHIMEDHEADGAPKSLSLAVYICHILKLCHQPGNKSSSVGACGGHLGPKP